GRPSLSGNTRTLIYYPGQIGTPPDASPRILNKSWTITADVDIPASGAEGMIVTDGGLEGGIGLYVRQGRPTFVYNFLSIERTTVTGNAPLPMGKVQVKVDFVYQGGPKEVGKPAVVSLFVNGGKVGEGRLARTIPATLSIGEGLALGQGVRLPGGFTYQPPFPFTGKIDK